MGFWSRIFRKRKREDELPHAYDNNNEVSIPLSASKPAKTTNIEPTLKAGDKPKPGKKQKKDTAPPVTNSTNASKDKDSSVPADASGKSRTGKFEIKKTKDGRFVFNLYASNHVIVATSQIYSSSQSALNGIKSIVTNAERAGTEDTTLKDAAILSFPKWEIYADKAGQYRFRLYAPNGSCICHSQGYTSKTSCKNGISSIIKTAKDAKVDKAYLEKDL